VLLSPLLVLSPTTWTIFEAGIHGQAFMSLRMPVLVGDNGNMGVN